MCLPSPQPHWDTQLKKYSLSSKPIEVVVGSEAPVTFYVHEKLLSKSSNFFEAALSHDWKESKERLIKLEEEDAVVFNVYLHWLYHATLPILDTSRSSSDQSEYSQLAKAFVLGEKLQDNSFKGAVLTAFDKRYDENGSEENGSEENQGSIPGGPVIRTIYDGTPCDSKVREKISGYWAKGGSEESLLAINGIYDVPKDFVVDLACQWYRKLDSCACGSSWLLSS